LRFNAREAGTLGRVEAKVVVDDELPFEHLHPTVLTAVIVYRRRGTSRPVE
jgi:hypothetical protein